MRLRLAENFRAIFYAPYYAALALEFFAREGVEIDLVNSSTPGGGVSALLDGSVDITWGGPMRVMKARELEGAPALVCFGEVVGRDPFCLVGTRRPSFRLEDLVALRFAAVSEVPTPWMCLQHDLRRLGIDPASLNRAPDQPMAANFEALCARQIDVVQLFEPYVSLAIEKGAGDLLYAASARGPTVYTTFIARRDRVAAHADAFAGMVRAIGRMQSWLADNDETELAEVTAAFYPDASHDLLTRALGRYREAAIWSSSTRVSHEGFVRLAESLLSGGYILRKPTYDECVDESLAGTHA